MNILVAIHSPFEVWNIPVQYVERLRRGFPDHTFLHARSDGEAEKLIGEAEVVFSSQVDRTQFDAARRLRWIHSPAAGVRSMLFEAMLTSPVAITNSRGMSADTMAEHVLAVTLAFFRQLPTAWRSQIERIWAQDAMGAPGHRTIRGATVLVVGLGAVGAAVASRMAALGACVVGVRRQIDAPPVPGVRAVVGPAQLRDELPRADVIVLSAAHTGETRGLIGAAELALMKPDAVIVNVSRGPLVDERALAEALGARRLGGAALDVFDREPLPADSPFWALPNVLITPHTSGFRDDHWEAATSLFEQNLRRYIAGEALQNVVDKRAGY